jgi:hypothetical protein
MVIGKWISQALGTIVENKSGKRQALRLVTSKRLSPRK